jgi:hypothetical protein
VVVVVVAALVGALLVVMGPGAVPGLVASAGASVGTEAEAGSDVGVLAVSLSVTVKSPTASGKWVTRGGRLS